MNQQITGKKTSVCAYLLVFIYFMLRPQQGYSLIRMLSYDMQPEMYVHRVIRLGTSV